jgi:hypothetical protein
MVTVRWVIIFFEYLKASIVDLFTLMSSSVQNSMKAVATAMAVIVLLTPAKNLNKVFWAFLVVSPLFNHYQGYV